VSGLRKRNRKDARDAKKQIHRRDAEGAEKSGKKPQRRKGRKDKSIVKKYVIPAKAGIHEHGSRIG
jgi:hypothetical protein